MTSHEENYNLCLRVSGTVGALLALLAGSYGIADFGIEDDD